MKASRFKSDRSWDEEGLGLFRAVSGRYQRSELSSVAYFAEFRGIFGEVALHRIFPEVLLLLPDQQKRTEVARCFVVALLYTGVRNMAGTFEY